MGLNITSRTFCVGVTHSPEPPAATAVTTSVLPAGYQDPCDQLPPPASSNDATALMITTTIFFRINISNDKQSCGL